MIAGQYGGFLKQPQSGSHGDLPLPTVAGREQPTACPKLKSEGPV